MHPYLSNAYSVSSPGFPERLIERMEKAGVGTLTLAQKSGVNKETISLWRGGTQKRYVIKKVAQVAGPLSTTVEELLGIAGEVDADPPSGREEAPQRELVRRIAALGPVIEKLPELEELVEEARRLSED